MAYRQWVLALAHAFLRTVINETLDTLAQCLRCHPQRLCIVIKYLSSLIVVPRDARQRQIMGHILIGPIKPIALFTFRDTIGHWGRIVRQPLLITLRPEA